MFRKNLSLILQRISSFDGHLIFPHLNLPTTIPEKNMRIQQPPQSPKTSPTDKWTQHLVTNFLSFNSPQYQPNHNKQEFADHHKLDFSLLPPTLNYKVIKFHFISACGYKFHALTI